MLKNAPLYDQLAKRYPEDCDPEMAKQVDELVQRLEKEKSITAKDVADRAAAQEGDADADDINEEWEDVEDGDADMV